MSLNGIKVQLDGKTYTWSGTEWCEDRTFLIPPEVVVRKLNALLTKQMELEDLQSSDVQDLLNGATQARDALQYERAERLAHRCLQVSPGHVGALAILCSTLRASGQPRRALLETSPFRKASYAPLLTSRAAAYCDLKQWDEAKREIGRALAIHTSEEAFSVVSRIRAARPDLYEKPR